MSTLTHEMSLSRSAGRKLWPFHVGAAADVVVGVGLVVFSGTIASLIMPAHEEVAGIATATILRGIGVFLILFATQTAIVARPHAALARFRSWIVAANWATVALAAGLIVAANAAFSAIGLAAVAVIGVFVAAITAFQQRAL